jgi:hypothetical protein
VTSGTLVFSTNKTDCHDITEILLKVALNTINQSNKHILSYFFSDISMFVLSGVSPLPEQFRFDVGKYMMS